MIDIAWDLGTCYWRRRIVAIVPAYNEAETISTTIDGLLRQTMPVDELIVVPNNCTDNTAEIAASYPQVRVMEYPGYNPHKKAGALNWVLEKVLPSLDDEDYVLITDADSKVVPGFVRSLWTALQDYEVGAACATFFIPDDRKGLLAALQRTEYARFARQIYRRNDEAIVLSGVGTMFRVHVLRQIANARASGRLPGGVGDLYHYGAATEDIEITFAVQWLGYRIIAPHDAVAYTDTMPSLKALKDQRTRWQRGMLDSIKLYGINSITWPHIWRLCGVYLGSMIVPLYLFTVAIALAIGKAVPFDPVWLPVIPVFMAERIVTVWANKWTDKLMALSLLPEWLYDQFRSYVYWWSLWLTLRNAQRSWVNY